YRRTGAIAELWPVHAPAVNIERDRQGRKYFEVAGNGTFTMNDIVHIPAFRLAGLDRGMSPIAAARQGIGVSIAAEKLAAKFFGQGSVMSGLLEVDADLSGKPEVVEALVTHFNKLHSGPENAFKVGV